MAEPQRANPSPKQRFQAITRAIAEHRAMVDSMLFQRSIEYAELQYHDALCKLAPSSIDSSGNIQASAACFQRLLGVHEFIRTLRNLSENPELTKKQSSDNLDYTK